MRSSASKSYFATTVLGLALGLTASAGPTRAGEIIYQGQPCNDLCQAWMGVGKSAQPKTAAGQTTEAEHHRIGRTDTLPRTARARLPKPDVAKSSPPRERELKPVRLAEPAPSKKIAAPARQARTDVPVPRPRPGPRVTEASRPAEGVPPAASGVSPKHGTPKVVASDGPSKMARSTKEPNQPTSVPIHILPPPAVTAPPARVVAKALIAVPSPATTDVPASPRPAVSRPDPAAIPSPTRTADAQVGPLDRTPVPAPAPSPSVSEVPAPAGAKLAAAAAATDATGSVTPTQGTVLRSDPPPKLVQPGKVAEPLIPPRTDPVPRNPVVASLPMPAPNTDRAGGDVVTERDFGKASLPGDQPVRAKATAPFTDSSLSVQVGAITADPNGTIVQVTIINRLHNDTQNARIACSARDSQGMIVAEASTRIMSSKTLDAGYEQVTFPPTITTYDNSFACKILSATAAASDAPSP